MNDLINKKCVPCEGGVIPFDISEIHKYQKKVDGWSLVKNQEEIFFLEKEFKFKTLLLFLALITIFIAIAAYVLDKYILVY